MVALKEAQSPLTHGGLYIVAGASGSVRALVDPNIARALPRLRPAVDCIGRILQRCLVDEGLAVTIKIERGPVAREVRSCA